MNESSYLSCERTVFVTGATGLLGGHVVRGLRRRGCGVVALVRSADKFQRLLGDSGAVCIEGDVRQTAAFESCLSGCSAVVHAAAYFREYYQPGDHREPLQAVNVDGTAQLALAAARQRVPLFVNVSSSGTVGMGEAGSPGDETTPPGAAQLKNLYFKSKLDAQARLGSLELGEMRVVHVLPGWMWGPADAAPTAAGQLLLDFASGRVPAVPRGGASVVDARDVAYAIGRILGGCQGQRYLVAGRFMTTREVLGSLAPLLDVRVPSLDLPTWLSLAHAHLEERLARLGRRRARVSVEAVRIMARASRVSSARAEQELGVRFRPFGGTAADTVHWYQEHGYLKDTKPALVPAARDVPGLSHRDSA